MEEIGLAVSVLFCLLLPISARFPFPHTDCGRCCVLTVPVLYLFPLDDWNTNYSLGSRDGSIVSLSLDPPPVGSCTARRGDTITATLEVKIGESLYLRCNSRVVHGMSKASYCHRHHSWEKKVPSSVGLIINIMFRDSHYWSMERWRW